MTERFITLAKASMRGNGVPNAPMVVLPKTELTEYVEPDVVRSVANQAVDLIIAQLRGAERQIQFKIHREDYPLLPVNPEGAV